MTTFLIGAIVFWNSILSFLLITALLASKKNDDEIEAIKSWYPLCEIMKMQIPKNIESCGVSADKSADQNVADVPSGDLISRADAVKAMRKLLGDDFGKRAEIELNCLTGYVPSAEKKEGEYADEIARRIATIIENEQDMRVILESADRPTSDDLIIKNGKGIQDGLYNIHNGEIFKYKAKGGTVRTYKLVPSVSADYSEECQPNGWMPLPKPYREENEE